MPIVCKLLIGVQAQQDLEEVWASDPSAAGVLEALLERLKTDQQLLDSLTVQGFGAYGTGGIHDTWVAQQRAGRNLWGPHWELEKQGKRYRMVYALDPRISRYYVLGIFLRDFNYDISDPRTLRVLNAYDQLGIPPYR
ncbi:MAG: hypothetical protein IPH71_05620 [Proteobacteria bacterium]|nr:hypothetical protein [Pseudomonadota bacterium]